MIAEELRQAIRVLKDQGRPLREISRALKVSRNTVRRVLREPDKPPAPTQDPRIQSIAPLLPALYRVVTRHQARHDASRGTDQRALLRVGYVAVSAQLVWVRASTQSQCSTKG